MIDPNSDTWHAVRDHCKKAIIAAQAKLESHGCPERDADFLRGEIRQAKAVLALEAQPFVQRTEIVAAI